MTSLNQKHDPDRVGDEIMTVMEIFTFLQYY